MVATNGGLMTRFSVIELLIRGLSQIAVSYTISEDHRMMTPGEFADAVRHVRVGDFPGCSIIDMFPLITRTNSAVEF